MKTKAIVLGCVTGASFVVMAAGVAVAGPVTNAQQFTEKAASQALSRSSNQNFSTNKFRYKDDSSSLINLGDSYNSDKADDLRLKPDESTKAGK